MLIHAATQSILLKVPDPFMIRDLLSKSRVIDHPDYNVAIKHTLESVKVLGNIGYELPSPIRSQYDWPGKYKPFDHQYEMAEFYTKHKRCFNLSEPGTGKTAATLWAADWMMKTKRVRKVLVLSPLSTLERVWASDIFDVLMHRVCSIVHGTRERREAALKVNADIYILNHDGVNIKWLAEAIRTRPDIDLVVVDEGSMFRNAGTTKYKALAKMLRPDMRLWWLTGTPCPNDPTDAWAQARLVNPNRVPQFFGAFKRMTMMQIDKYKWVPRVDAFRLAYDALQPAIRFKKADCLDLPPVTYQDRQAGLTKEQLDAFKTMKNDMVAAAASGEKITAVNAADKINKLRQILCGAVKDPTTEEYVTIPHGPRTKVLLECIEQATAKVIVIVPFKGIIRELVKEIEKHHTVEVLNGDVSAKNRDDIVRRFKQEANPRILLCHPKVMSHGLNLTEADTLIFYAPIYSNDEFQQVTERFNRAGQTRKMTIIQIASHPLEWGIYKLVDTKKLTQDSILNLYRTVTDQPIEGITDE